jgi:hypothetical protein
VLVSTDAEAQTTKVKYMVKPQMINTYHRNMNGCDKLDQKVSNYCVFERKAVKWWNKKNFLLDAGGSTGKMPISFLFVCVEPARSFL